jgi:hypothetical protein
VTTASDWVDGLRAQVQEFSRARGTPPVVDVRLSSGEAVKVQRVEPGPGDFFVTLQVYPDVEPGDAILEAMVRDAEGEYHTARVLAVNLHRIDRVELLHDVPAARTLGFRTPGYD